LDHLVRALAYCMIIAGRKLNVIGYDVPESALLDAATDLSNGHERFFLCCTRFMSDKTAKLFSADSDSSNRSVMGLPQTLSSRRYPNCVLDTIKSQKR
jgi:hypothetical protein